MVVLLLQLYAIMYPNQPYFIKMLRYDKRRWF